MKKHLFTLLSHLIRPGRVPIPKGPKRILIIRSGGLGDVIMTTPLVRAIRKKYPSSEISYLVGKWSALALKHNKHINHVLEFDDRIVFEKKTDEVMKLIKELRKKKFEMVFVLDKSYHWNLFSYLLGIPVRIGFDRNGEGFANHYNVSFKGTKYELDYYMDIAGIAGAKTTNKEMELFTLKKHKTEAIGFVKKSKLKGKIVGIAPGGAENPGQAMHAKRWPIVNYIALVDQLTANNDISVMLFGGKNDLVLIDQIKEKVENKRQVFIVAGTSLHTSFELMKKCTLFITHDSGPMHMAAAAKIPIIALFGPTDAKRFAPKNAVVIKSSSLGCPCYDIYGNYNKAIAEKCMDAIKVETVYTKINAMINKKR